MSGIENAEFICGKAEDCVPSLMRRVGGEEVVVVVDPPRSGLREFYLFFQYFIVLFT